MEINFTNADEQNGYQPAIQTGIVPTTCLDSEVVEPLRVGKPDLWKRLVGIYLESTPEDIEKLAQGLADGDCTTVQLTAHSLKSSSANMGATKLAELYR